MKAEISNLVKLQAKDDQIRALESRLAEIPKEVEELEREIATEKKNLKAAEDLRQIEKEIRRDIRRGKDLASVLGYDDILRRKSTEVFLPQMRFKNGRIRK